MAKDTSADGIMFPWVVRSADVTTVISVINTAETDAEALGLPFHNNRIHIEYWHKLTTANDQEEACREYDFEVTSSKDDMVTWDMAGYFNNGFPMFNDTSNEVIGVPDMTLAVEDPRRGFLLVDNNTQALVDSSCEGDVYPDLLPWRNGPGCNVDGTMYGEATIIEHKTGAAWGYIAYNPWGGQKRPQDGDIDLEFSDLGDQQGEVIGGDETTQTTLLNPNDAMTKLFVTPIGWEDDPDRDQRRGNWNARVQLCRFPERNTGQLPLNNPYTGDCTSGGIWNNEEGGFSFTTKKNIVCTSADNIVDFFGGAGTSAYTQWVASGKAGWTYIVTHWGTIDERDGTDQFWEAKGANIGKLEYGTNLNWGGSIADTINTFVWLRDNSSRLFLCQETPLLPGCQGGPRGINIFHNRYALQEVGACCISVVPGCIDKLTEDTCNSLLISLIWSGPGISCSQVNCRIDNP
jgi:hypothetical protein